MTADGIPWPSGWPTTTYLLGAGFSRAISGSMPLLNELGRRVHEADPVLKERVARHEIEDFETWMSLVATAEPYRNRAENYESLGLYSRAVRQVGRVLQDEVSIATRGDLPNWLRRLVQIWHATKAPVATFNYDTLTEIAARRGTLYDPSERLVLPWPTVINFAPGGNDKSIGEDSRNIAWSSFRLLKLHGSVNWFWVPEDSSGATLERTPLFEGAVEEERSFDTSRWLPGREPYIVPPVATKSVFYGGPLTSHLWQLASTALADSEELVIMGYSMPVTDLTTLGLLRESLRSKQTLKVTVCDPNPGPVVERLTGLLSPDIELEVTTFDGPDAVSNFVEERWRTVRSDVVTRLRSRLLDAGDTPVSVNGDRQEVRQVSSFTRSNDSLILHASNSFHTAMWREDSDLNPDENIGPSYFVSASAVAAAMDGCVEVEVKDRTGRADVWGGRESTLGVRRWFDLYANLPHQQS
ncbi:hypothetical protein [Microbacterium sp. Root61]|uniref:hypothetical protein n=1 Tax=Microbacterium sp. Root61 TaxID=1736570 RepID=UPI000ABC914E|nr:hypothetical protein [Microbacterium sp. Root61]